MLYGKLFVVIETYINKARKSYQDSRARRHLTKLNDELQDVQKIMVQNIEDVLQRGENISSKLGEETERKQ